MVELVGPLPKDFACFFWICPIEVFGMGDTQIPSALPRLLPLQQLVVSNIFMLSQSRLFGFAHKSKIIFI